MAARLRAGLRGESAWAIGLLVLAAALVVRQGHATGVQQPGALHGVARDVTKTALGCLALFGVCGYGTARLALPAAWRGHLLLFTLPVGAACSALSLTVLGVLHVGAGTALVVVLSAFGLLTAYALARGPQPARTTAPRVVHIVVPAALAALVAAVSLMPSLRAGFATVQGQNGDAILAVGTADFLQHAPPGAVRPELALDRIPIQWNSKLPIYYVLGAVPRISGQDIITAFPTVAAMVLAMFAIGLFLVAFHALRAPPLVALLAAFLVPLDRIIVHVSMHTYYNQLWALFALPFVLLTGARLLREPERGTALLFVLFLALALFGYPLLLPFPAVFLAVMAWRERGRARAFTRRLRFPRWAWAAGLALAVPLLIVLGKGVIEKVVPAISALLPGGDLSGWAGGNVLPYLPVGRFVGVEVGPLWLQLLVLGAIAAATVLGLRTAPRDVAVAFAVLFVGALLAGLYLRLRGQGELFWFKDLGFVGPLMLLFAVLGLARGVRRGAAGAVAAVGLAALTVGLLHGAQREIDATYELGSHDVLALRDWDREIPADQTIRIDIEPGSWQLWGWYLMPRHRVSASQPLAGFFPHPPFGLHADLSLTRKPFVPPDAIGPPLLENPGYAIYRLRQTPGLDTSSRTLIFDVKKITYG